MDRNNENEVDRMIAERFSAFRPESDWRPNLRRGLRILRERRAASRKGGRNWIFVAAGTAVACLPIMALPVTRAFAARCVSACVQETAAVREVLLGPSSPTSSWLKPGDRRMAPDFTLTDASGQPVRLSGSRGKVVLLNFWATWCVPCGQEIPWFIEFRKSNAARGFEVLGVSMDDGGWAAVRPYIEQRQINYPVMIGNDQVAGLFGGLHSLPLTLIIDRTGRIASVHAGLCRKDEYESDIDAVLSER
jgi:peroxiredoxin